MIQKYKDPYFFSDIGTLNMNMVKQIHVNLWIKLVKLTGAKVVAKVVANLTTTKYLVMRCNAELL